MEGKRPIAERLREACKSEPFNNDLTYDIKVGEIYVNLSWEEASNLADEIEKYYIPRPRFEDGEPVQDSDMEEIGALATCCVFTDGSWMFNPDKYEDERNPKPWDKQDGSQCDRIRRPTPKVLDADGVAYEKGQTVWRIRDGKEGNVVEVEMSDHPVCVDFGNDELVWCSSDILTHEKPVFDSDGVRICKGDTVYRASSGNGVVVTGFDACGLVEVETQNGGHWKDSGNNLTHEKPLFDANNEVIKVGDVVFDIEEGDKYTVKLAYGHTGKVFFEGGGYMSACHLTHCEPDSLEKLRDDVDNLLRDCSCDTDTADGIERRFTALIERGA